MKTEWDYSNLAQAYLKRVDYSTTAITSMLKIMQLEDDAPLCDIGAGTAHLTLALLKEKYNVTAIEPNDNMRALGRDRTKQYENVEWYEGSGENTLQPSNQFAAVTYGSSFNVMDRALALKEAKRILRPKGWIAAMWNHRNLNDPIQREIEAIISSKIEHYNYGTRREDQTEIINKSGLFSDVIKIESEITHSQTVPEIVEAWRSHATLARQAKSSFDEIIKAIDTFLTSLDKERITVPYTTRIWMAQLKE